MRSVSNQTAYLNACKAPVKVIQARVVLSEPNETDITITSADNLISWKLVQSGYFFNAVATQAQVSILRADWADLVGKTAKLYFSVKTSSDPETWQEVMCGQYVVTEQTVNLEKETTTLKLLDTIAKMSETGYDDIDFTYPTTVQNLAEQVATARGMELETPATLTNGSYVIQENLWLNISETSIRDVVCQIAGATGTIARVRADGTTLDFIGNQVPQSGMVLLTYGEMRKWKRKEYYGKINTITISREPEEDNIVVQDADLVAQYGTVQVKLANNEILDDDRETLISPILNATKGAGFYTGELTTIGIGLIECGDYFQVNDGDTTYVMLATDVELTIDGGMKEVIKCVAPEEKDTNYALAGSIYKTVFNTEIKVDKQGNEIISIVSRQDEAEASTSEQFTQIRQDLDNITTTVQKTGSGNFIKNSVGYGKENDGTITFWTYENGANTSNVTSESSPSSLNAGAVSGNEIAITGATISQVVNLTAGQEYNLSVRVFKDIVGSAKVRISNNVDDIQIEFPDQTASNWDSKDVTFVPTENYVKIELTTSSGTLAYFTDLMLCNGGKTSWRQASGEIYNAQVSIDSNGMRVSSAQYQGDYVEITPLEFAGFSNASGTQKKVFSLNRDTTEVEKLLARTEIDMPPLKITPIVNSSNSGWAFVKRGE